MLLIYDRRLAYLNLFYTQRFDTLFEISENLLFYL